jgi:hypothetical protein
MKSITFRYRDEMSHWEWKTQHCTVESVEECIRIYGLGTDCEYEIVEVIYDYNGFKIAEINEETHTKLMKYWTDDEKIMQLPNRDSNCYLYWNEKDKLWDAIYAIEGSDTWILCGEDFIHKEYALKWLAGEFEDTDELKIEDRKAGN